MSLPAPRSQSELLRVFSALALQGFRGLLPIAQRGLVERRQWLTRDEFIEMLSVGQVLPGPNVVNLALMIGDRFFGWRGAFAALGGLLALPLGRWPCALALSLTLVGVGVMRWPMACAVLGIGGLAVAAAWWQLGRTS